MERGKIQNPLEEEGKSNERKLQRIVHCTRYSLVEPLMLRSVAMVLCVPTPPRGSGKRYPPKIRYSDSIFR